MTNLDDQLTGLQTSRRSVVRGAAWSVPVVAVAATAPAYAASPCDPIARTIDWGTTQYTRSSVTSSTYTIPDPDGTGPGQALTLTISTTTIGSNTQTGPQATNGADDNLRLFTGQVGGSSASTNHLTLHQSPINNANKSNNLTNANRTITRFSFSRTVASLGFTLRDIDATTNDFWDAIALVGLGSTTVTGTATDPASVIGAGTTANPWRGATAGTRIEGNQNNGNVVVSMTNVTGFDLYYWNITSASSGQIDGDQKVFLSTFDVTYKPC